MEHFNRTFKIDAQRDISPITFSHARTLINTNGHQLHLNDHTEIYIFISGDAHYIIEDGSFTLKKGDVLIIPPNKIHVLRPNSRCEYERFYLLLPNNCLDGYVNDPLSSLLKKAEKGGYRITTSEQIREKALNILYSISMLNKNGKQPDMLLAHTLVIQFLLVLHSSVVEERAEKTVAVSGLLRDILIYIGKNASQIVSASDIANHFHISSPYLSTLFKKNLGVTVSSYLRTKKIAIAKLLLEEGGSVAYACYESGFSDSSYFIKIFKSQTGITPYKYKEQKLKK